MLSCASRRNTLASSTVYSAHDLGGQYTGDLTSDRIADQQLAFGGDQMIQLSRLRYIRCGDCRMLDQLPIWANKLNT
jgi:hypothetical protein